MGEYSHPKGYDYQVSYGDTCDECGASKGRTPSLLSKWHYCSDCGAILCPRHGKQYAQCPQCSTGTLLESS